MDFKDFLDQFSNLADKLFLDRHEAKPQAKAKVWCDACIADIKEKKYSATSVIRAMERLLRSDKQFLGLNDLVHEIRSERIIEIG